MVISFRSIAKVNTLLILISSVATLLLGLSGTITYLFAFLGLLFVFADRVIEREFTMSVPSAILIIFFIYMFSRSFNHINIPKTFFEGLKAYASAVSMFLSASLFFDENDYNQVIKYWMYLFIPHTILSVIQAFMYSEADLVGGMFGTTFGLSNTCSHAYVLLTTIVVFCQYFDGKKSFLYLSFYSLLAVVTATAGEIKVYYFELLILVIFFLVFEKKRYRSLFLLCMSALLIWTGSKVIAIINPHFDNFLSASGIQSYLDEGYAGKQNAATRTNGFEFVSEELFDNNVIYELLGRGLGGNDIDEADSLNVFYFSYTRIFYTLGILGELLVIIFLLSIVQISLKKEKSVYKYIPIFVASFSLFILFYSSEFTHVNTSGMYFILLSTCNIKGVTKNGKIFDNNTSI